MRKQQAGFSVLELLVAGAVIATIAAIAIYNYMAALNRAKQKRTVNDIRILAQAWEARATDTNSYAVAGFTFPGTAVPYSALAAALRPTYLRDIPQVDGWLRPLQFGVEAAAGTRGEYAIRSAGRDGIFENTYTPGTTQDPDCDIVFSDGSFITYPDTVQTN